MPYILFAALLGSLFGFLSCAILTARRIRNADKDAWREARAYFANLYGKQAD